MSKNPPIKAPKPGRSMVIRVRLPDAVSQVVTNALRRMTTQAKGKALAMGLALMGQIPFPGGDAGGDALDALAGQVTTALIDAGVTQARGRASVVQAALREALEGMARGFDLGTERER